MTAFLYQRSLIMPAIFHHQRKASEVARGWSHLPVQLCFAIDDSDAATAPGVHTRLSARTTRNEEDSWLGRSAARAHTVRQHDAEAGAAVAAQVSGIERLQRV
jgi:hypothetical protein